MNEKSIRTGRYRHYKGNEYTVVGTARHSETLEELVVYRREYGEHGLWVRPKQMFSETVTLDGQEVRRFQSVGSSSEQFGEKVSLLVQNVVCQSRPSWLLMADPLIQLPGPISESRPAVKYAVNIASTTAS